MILQALKLTTTQILIMNACQVLSYVGVANFIRLLYKLVPKQSYKLLAIVVIILYELYGYRRQQKKLDIKQKKHCGSKVKATPKIKETAVHVINIPVFAYIH